MSRYRNYKLEMVINNKTDVYFKIFLSNFFCKIFKKKESYISGCSIRTSPMMFHCLDMNHLTDKSKKMETRLVKNTNLGKNKNLVKTENLVKNKNSVKHQNLVNNRNLVKNKTLFKNKFFVQNKNFVKNVGRKFVQLSGSNMKLCLKSIHYGKQS